MAKVVLTTHLHRYLPQSSMGAVTAGVPSLRGEGVTTPGKAAVAVHLLLAGCLVAWGAWPVTLW